MTPAKRQRPALHGTRSRYQGGCRCDACREANRAYIETRRRTAGVEPLKRGPQAGHGSSAMYVHHGCRCDLCTAVNTDAHRRNQRRRNNARAERSETARANMRAAQRRRFRGAS